MARSRKKNPYWSVTCCGCRAGVERAYKRQAHRQLRRAVRVAIARDWDAVMPHDKQFGDPWVGPKDGKSRWDEPRGYRK